MTKHKLRLGLTKPKIYAFTMLVVGFACYVFGFKQPLLAINLLLIAAFVPMPKVFNSWLSRSAVGVIFLYALLQLAAMVQFMILPQGRFPAIAGLLCLLNAGLILPFNLHSPGRRLISFKDILAVSACLLFIAAFAPVFRSGQSTSYIADIAGTQISDSVAHFGTISGYNKVENLNYKVGEYYPAGFHISTAFTQDGAIGNINTMSWKAHVQTYFLQYMIWGCILGFLLVYSGFFLYELISEQRKASSYIAIALTLGACLTLQYLLLYVNEGYVNFFYVTASFIIAMVYILATDIYYKPKSSLKEKLTSYTWPLSAFLLLGFGAGFSWPLMVLPLFGTLALIGLPLLSKELLSDIRDATLSTVPIILLVGASLMSLYFQAKYFPNGGDVIKYGGGITSFNILFLLLGLGAVIYCAVTFQNISKRLVSVFMPYVILLACFMLWQIFAIGEIRYYVIKSSLVLEIMGLLVIVAVVANYVQHLKVHSLLQVATVFGVVLFVVAGSIAFMPKPLLEVRGMYRDASGMGRPPFQKNDSRIVTQLGLANKINDFNVTVLHTDPSTGRVFAHAQTALWANAMTGSYADVSMSISGSRSSSCFGVQYSILAYGSGSSEEQQRLIDSVNRCADEAKQKGQNYYVVTEPASLPRLKELLNNNVLYAL